MTEHPPVAGFWVALCPALGAGQRTTGADADPASPSRATRYCGKRHREPHQPLYIPSEREAGGDLSVTGGAVRAASAPSATSSAGGDNGGRKPQATASMRAFMSITGFAVEVASQTGGDQTSSRSRVGGGQGTKTYEV